MSQASLLVPFLEPQPCLICHQQDAREEPWAVGVGQVLSDTARSSEEMLGEPGSELGYLKS